MHAFFARDKFELTDRVSIEAGVRFEKQTGSSDIGASTVDSSVLAPRVSGTYDLTGTGKSLILGSSTSEAPPGLKWRSPAKASSC